ncbi:MAG TPA: hypothetical protein VL358_04745 [Caulobacteraceae bacterium]|jgi:hypothetical protein|nr:hypothetical protein [Caulobacteraceae bacterium]
MQAPPDELALPPLAHWMFRRGMKPAQAAVIVGVSRMQFSRYLLPFGDPRRQVPSEAVMERIQDDLTGGEISAADHYPPKLSGRPGAEAVLAAARAE